MNKKLMIVTILFVVIGLLGCEKESDLRKKEGEDKIESEDNMGAFELVSVEEFRDYYNIDDNEISDEVLENFIFD